MRARRRRASPRIGTIAVLAVGVLVSACGTQSSAEPVAGTSARTSAEAVAAPTAPLTGIVRPAATDEPADRLVLTDVLVYTATAGFRHSSIDDGVAAILALGVDSGFSVVHTEDPADFTDARLAAFDVVVFLNTTGDMLDERGEDALERYVRAGGGWVGIHSAADTEYDWPFYGELLGGGAWFLGHPPGTHQATLHVDPEQAGHPSVAHLAPSFTWDDEWYAFRANPGGSVDPLLRVDESTDPAGDASMGDDHPIAWSHTVDAGRAWYTAIGHRDELYSDPAYRAHLLGGIVWAAGLR